MTPQPQPRPTGWALIHEAHADRRRITVHAHADRGIVTLEGVISEISDDDFTIVTLTRSPTVPWENVQAVVSHAF